VCAHPTEHGDEEADSRTLLNLIGVRQLIGALDSRHPRVIAEIKHVENIALADMRGSDDFVISDAIASQLVVQLAEQPQRQAVFLELYAPQSPSIHLVPADRLGLNGPIQVSTIYETAYRVGLLAIGWRPSHAAHQSDIVLNPHPSQQVTLEPADQIIVIA
jgi:hypothetical protein